MVWEMIGEMSPCGRQDGWGARSFNGMARSFNGMVRKLFGEMSPFGYNDVVFFGGAELGFSYLIALFKCFCLKPAGFVLATPLRFTL
jgi:hypothetical protein